MDASRVVIVGGGITGLSAAYELHRQGADFLLLEASPRLGGILRTDYARDLVIDAGPDAMLARKPAGIELCAELGIADRLLPANPPRVAFVVRDGRLEPLPPPFPPPGAAGDETHDQSIASFFLRHYGLEAVERYAEPVLAGIHAGDVDRLSINALFPEIVRRPGGPQKQVPAPDPHGLFRSFPRGMQELVDALAAALPADRVRLNAPVRRLDPDATRWIIATPAYVAGDLVSASDPELAGLCRSIRYVSSGIAVLAYPREAVGDPLAGSGFVVPRVEPSMRIIAATWLSSKWPGRAPRDVALIRAFFGGARDPDAMHLDDDAVAGLAHRDLSRLLRIDRTPSFARVYRWPNGTPQYDVGYLDTLERIRRRAAAHRIQLVGAGFGTIGIPDCIAAGREAARAALI